MIKKVLFLTTHFNISYLLASSLNVNSMKEWIRLVWPIINITTCSLLDFLKAGLHSPKVGWISKSLLWMFMSYRCCHFVRRNLLIVGFKSVDGMEVILGLRSKADLAAESALSFPLTPMWLIIQHKIISFWLDIEFSLLSSLTINEFSNFLFFSDVNTESESENINKPEPQPQCLTCQTTCTVKHILIECRAFAVIRKQFFKVNSLTDLFENVKIDDVLSFFARDRVVRKHMTT